MAKFVPDIKTQRWIVIAPARVTRPDEHRDPAPKKICVFCSPNEHLTPAEMMRIGEGEKDKPGWKVRVVPNKFPITDIHEVIIHSPYHDQDIADLSLEQVTLLVSVYRSRFQYHQQNGQVMIFSNHGEHAGASLTHPHSQLVVIPRQINLDALVREPMMNIVEDNKYFITYCPDFSQWPYEVWIAPKKTGTNFGNISDEELNDLVRVWQNSLKRLAVKYKDASVNKMYPELPFAYNYYIHHGQDWFIRIIPRLIHRAGFELGTGLSVNIVDPTVAAAELKAVNF